MVDRPNEDRIAKAIKENFKEAEMDAIFRQSILNMTRARVSKRSGHRLTGLQYAFGISAMVVTAVLLLMLVVHRAVPIATHTAANNLISTQVKTAVQASAGQAATEKSEDRTGLKPSPSNLPQPGVSGMGKGAAVLAAVPAIATNAKKSVSDLVVMSKQSEATDGNGKALKVGDHLVGAFTVRTGKIGRIALISKNGSQIYLASQTRLIIRGDGSTEIKSGRIYCVNRRGDFKAIRTPAANLKLLGTTVDTAVLDSTKAAVTVVEGKVQATNSHGSSIVDAGKRAVLMADASPAAGESVNTTLETAWYDGRGKVISSTGQIAYIIRRQNSQLSEIWAMNADGSGKHLVKSYLGYIMNTQWFGDKLMINMGSLLWSTPNQAKRVADAGAGHPIIKGRAVLLDTSTGLDVSLNMPDGCNVLYIAVSADCSMVAFVGNVGNEGGIWVFKIGTGEMKKVFNGWIKTAPSWAPDNRHLIAATGEGYGTDYPLSMVDIQTGHIQDLHAQGAGAAVSPDGKKIAYCGGFKSSGSWMQGVPTSGSVYVMDLASGTSVRVSPEGEGALEPSWSPDGSRILYHISDTDWNDNAKSDFKLFSVNADGSDKRLVSKGNGILTAAQWSSDGDSIVVNSLTITKSADKCNFENTGTLLVKADGSGSVNIGGTEKDSVVAHDIESQIGGVSKDVREGIFDYAMTQVKLFEGRPDDVISAKRLSADAFSQLIWKYPLAKLSALNTLAYADAASKVPEKSNAEMLADSCKMRMDYLRWEIRPDRKSKAFPSDLKSLESSLIGSNGGINWLMFTKDAQAEAWTNMMFRCPVDGVMFNYNPPTKDSKDGDVILSCPNHPQNKIVLDEEWKRLIR
jgi:hypothetical protein